MGKVNIGNVGTTSPYDVSTGPGLNPEELQDYYKAIGIANQTKVPTAEQLAGREEDIYSYSDLTGVEIPPTKKQAAVRTAPGRRTAIRGPEESLSTAVPYEILQKRIEDIQRTDRRNPINNARFMRQESAEDYVNIMGAQQQAIPSLMKDIPNLPFQDTMRGIGINYADDFNPNTQQNALVGALHAENLEEWVADNVGPQNLRTHFNPKLIARDIEVIRGWSNRFKNFFDKKYAGDMSLKDPVELAAMQRLLLSKGYTPATFSEFLYKRVAPASQLMEENSPAGLSGAMVTSVLQFLANARKTTNLEMAEIVNYPKTQAEYDALTDKQKHGVRGLEEDLWRKQQGGDKQIGHLIAQAGNMILSGQELGLVGATALESVVEAFGEEMFIKVDMATGPMTVLSDFAYQFVNDNPDLFNTLLNEPPKLPRIGKDNLVEQKDVDYRGKAVAHVLRKWKNNNTFDTEEATLLNKVILQGLDNTPFTTLSTQSQVHGFLSGHSLATGVTRPNSTSVLYDSPEFKNILHGGEEGSRSREYDRFNPVTGEMERVRDFSDTEKDTKYNLNLVHARKWVGEQIRFNHFMGSNVRFYIEANVLNPSDHFSRAILGAGSYISYNTKNKKHVSDLKAGIMTMTGMKVPGKGLIKYDRIEFPERAKGFDEHVEDWQAKYGILVTAALELDNHYTPEFETRILETLENPDSEMSLAAKDLLEFGEANNGYYTVNAVIEAVKFKMALDKGREVFKSNFMFEADGTSNGLAINALFIANSEILQMTGVTDFIVNPEHGFGVQHNLLTRNSPPEEHAELVQGWMTDQVKPAWQELLRLGLEHGFIGASSSKSHTLEGSYGAGYDSAIETSGLQFDEIMKTNPEVMGMLRDKGWRSEDEVKAALGQINWDSLVGITKELRRYNGLQSQFMAEVLIQYEADPSLPAPVTTLDSGFLMRHGVPAPTVHGIQMFTPDGTPVRQLQNVVNPLGKKRKPGSAFLDEYPGAQTAAPVKMTHATDAYMVGNVVLRGLNENPGLKDGVKGNVLLQMYDGFFGAPMYADWMDVTLNQEFLNLGYEVNNLGALVDSAEAQGYDIKTPRMKQLTAQMAGLELEGRKALEQGKWKHINQFQIKGLVKPTGTKTVEGKVKPEYSPFGALYTYTKAAKPKKFGTPPTGRQWNEANFRDSYDATRLDEFSQIGIESNRQILGREKKLPELKPLYKVGEAVFHPLYGEGKVIFINRKDAPGDFEKTYGSNVVYTVFFKAYTPESYGQDPTADYIRTFELKEEQLGKTPDMFPDPDTIDTQQLFSGQGRTYKEQSFDEYKSDIPF